MAWFYNTRTKFYWQIEEEGALEIARLSDDLQEVEGPDTAPEGTDGPDKQPEDHDNGTEGSDDPLDTMSKADLSDLAKSMGIPTSGRNMEQLKVAIREAE
jgi:hypothetical protein